MFVYEVDVVGPAQFGVLFVATRSDKPKDLEDAVDRWCRGRIAGGHKIVKAGERNVLFDITRKTGVVMATVYDRYTDAITRY